MKWAIIIEQDPAIAEELKSILLDVDPALTPEIFPDLNELQTWLKETIAQKKEKKLEDATIALMIGSHEMFNKNFMGLLCRLREFLIRRELATREAPPVFVLTAFDDPRSQPKQAMHEVVSNILYKPLDRIIASQTLMNSLSPGKAFSLKYVYAQKSTVVIEALKEVPLFRLSEYGFTTLSDRPIEVGMIAKFHHKIFITGPRPGVYARCRSCQEDAQVSPGKFVCHFSYYSITNEQVQAVRKFLKTQPKAAFQPSFPFYNDPRSQKDFAKTKNLTSEEKKSVAQLIKKEKPQTVIIVDSDKASARSLKELVTRNFSNASVIEYPTYLSFLLDVDPSFSEAKTKEKPAFPHVGAIEVSINLAEQSIMKTNPETPEGADFLGSPFKSVMNKAQFLPERVLEADKENLQKLLEKPDAQPVVLRFLYPSGQTAYLEFQFKSRATEKDAPILFTIKELSLAERVEHLKIFRRFKGEIDALFLSESAMGEALVDRISVLCAAMEKEKVIPSERPQLLVAFVKDPRRSIDQNQGLHPRVTGLLPITFDRSLFLQLCAIDENELNSIEIKKSMQYVEIELELKASTNVTAEELSESGIVFKYYREIKLGDFRSFHLPLEIFGKVEDDTDLVELLGRCHHTVKIDEKSGFMTYFTLFGMTDIYLKHVRSWMKRHYVNAKSEEAA